MLLINQHLDKLTAAHAEYISRGILPPDPKTCMVPSVPLPDVENENLDVEAIDSAVEGWLVMARHQCKYLLIFLPGSNVATNTFTHHLTEPCSPRQIKQLADYVGAPQLLALMEQFLQHQLSMLLQVDSLDNVSRIIGPISVFHSASVNFFAPSDQSGIRGMWCEIIRSTPRWLVFQSPVATDEKNRQPNWTATDLDRTAVAHPGGRVIRLVAVAVTQAKLKDRLQPVFCATSSS